MQYPYMVWQEEGVWTAHSPSVPGAYGVGSTAKKAEADLFDALEELFDYLDEIGEAPPKPRKLKLATLEIRTG